MADMDLQIKISGDGSDAVKKLDEVDRSLKQIYEDGGLAALGMQAFSLAAAGIDKIAKTLDEASKGLKKFGRDFTQNVTLPITALVGLSLKKVFDDAIIGKGTAATNKFAAEVQNLKKQFDLLLISLGTTLAPIATKVTAIFTNLINAFRSLSPQTQQMVIYFGLFAASIGPVILGFSAFLGIASKLIGVISTLAGVLGTAFGILTSPITLIAALVFTLAGLTNVFFKLKESGLDTSTALQETFFLFVTFFNDKVVGSILLGVSTIVKSFSDLSDSTKEKVVSIATLISPGLGAIAGVVASNFKGAMDNTVAVLDEWQATLSARFEGVKEVIDAQLGKIGSSAGDAFTFGLSTSFDEILANFKNMISGLTTESGKTIELFSSQVKQITQDIKLTIAGNLSSALLDIAEGAKTAEEAFRDFAKSTIRYLLDMIIKAQIFKALSSFAGFNTAVGGVAKASTIAPVPLATGGLITGPGSGTSDSIMARLSNGEFVTDAKTVKTLGANFFHNLKKMAKGGVSTKSRGSMPAFADGGMVTGSVGAPQVIIQNNGTPKETTSTRFDPASAVTTVILEDISKNGNISKSLQRNFGVKRSSFR